MGSVAFAYRYQNLANGSTDQTCLDLNEQVYCHEDMNDVINSMPKPSFFKDVHLCAGMKNAPWSEFNGTRVVPLLSNQTIDKRLNDTVHVGEIFMKCPVCHAEKVFSR